VGLLLHVHQIFGGESLLWSLGMHVGGESDMWKAHLVLLVHVRMVGVLGDVVGNVGIRRWTAVLLWVSQLLIDHVWGQLNHLASGVDTAERRRTRIPNLVIHHQN
jgi:hypothetical protein